MGAALKLQPISVSDYLDGELVSDVKHEYLGGGGCVVAELLA